MQRKLLIILMFLASCTFPVTVTIPETVTPVAPVEEPVQPAPNSGGGNVVEPTFSDPADLIIEAEFDLLAAPNGRGDCLTLQTPCSLQKASELLEPGMTLMLRGGTYPAGVTLTVVDATEPTLITSYPNEVPVIDGSYKPDVPGLSIVGDKVTISHVDFRYNWTGLYVEGGGINVMNVNAYANRVEGVYARGSQVLFDNVHADNNSVGIKVESALSILRYSSVTNNVQGLLLNGPNSIIEYVEAINNDQGIVTTDALVRFNIAKNNRAGIISAAGSLIYNNTIIGGEKSFVSATSEGQESSTYFYNLIYQVDAPELLYDTNIANSWNFNITEPKFVSTDENSPLFARLDFDSPALKVSLPEGIPITNPTGRLGAWGTP